MNWKTGTTSLCVAQTRPRPLKAYRAPGSFACSRGESHPNGHRNRAWPISPSQEWLPRTVQIPVQGLSTLRPVLTSATICSLNSAGYGFLVLGMISTSPSQLKKCPSNRGNSNSKLYVGWCGGQHLQTKPNMPGEQVLISFQSKQH